MSTFIKRLLLCVIGALAGAACWPFTEMTIYNQGMFSTYLIFTVFVGMVFGLFIGTFFATSEGVFLQDKSKILKGLATGAVIGALGGAVGFLAGQFVLFIVGENFLHSAKDFESIGLPIARAVSWAVLGIFIGIIEGVRSFSSKKIMVGVIGGFLGGALGGIVFEALKYFLTSTIIARISGLMIFGLLIGLFYGLIEKSLSYGVLRLLNGVLRGKEFLINQKKIKIGKSVRNDFILKDYANIESQHAVIFVKKGDLFIKNSSSGSTIKVNDDVTQEHRLKFEDVIKIGEAKFLYKFK